MIREKVQKMECRKFKSTKVCDDTGNIHFTQQGGAIKMTASRSHVNRSQESMGENYNCSKTFQSVC